MPTTTRWIGLSLGADAAVWEYDLVEVEVEATGERIQVPLVVEAPPPGAV